MPWKECSAVSCREEFVGLAQAEWAKMLELCRRFGVSRRTGYKWLRRYASAGVSGLLDRSRRPPRSRAFEFGGWQGFMVHRDAPYVGNGECRIQKIEFRIRYSPFCILGRPPRCR